MENNNVKVETCEVVDGRAVESKPILSDGAMVAIGSAGAALAVYGGVKLVCTIKNKISESKGTRAEKKLKRMEKRQAKIDELKEVAKTAKKDAAKEAKTKEDEKVKEPED